jgi:tetratricopeptide (TPR) repeat protein
MKSLQITFIIFMAVLLPGSALAQQVVSTAADRGSAFSGAAAQQDTAAQHGIAEARQQIAADPKKAQAYNDLAIAYMRRARETANPRYLKDADSAVAQGLQLDADDFQLRRTASSVSLNRHRYAEARERAMALHDRRPDDVLTYGVIAEADIGLGNYPEAETNAQWMMNLRPNNTPALLVGAALRNIYGNTHGAIDFLNRAYAQTSPSEAEDLAWISNQIASIQIETGQNDAAAQTLEQADQLVANYPWTVENLALVRMAQGKASEAVQLWTRASALDHDPHVLFELAQAQAAAGSSAEARNAFTNFRKLMNEQAGASDQAGLDLILMYAGDPATAAAALRLGQQQIAARQDVWTLDAYAWALYANGRFQDADDAAQKAIMVGIRSAQIFDHAGHIAQKMNRAADATKYFKLAVEANAESDFGADAMKSTGQSAQGESSKSVASQPAAVANVVRTDLPHEPPAAASQPEVASASTGVEKINSPVAFAPVPESLLMPQPTGTARALQGAQASVARNPKDAAGYAGLGAAYFQRARETGDVSDYQLAEDSLRKSLDLVSADFSADDALGTMAEVCMGEHRFADALRYAQKALSLGTGDLSPFAIVGDAYADMGEYDKAAIAYGRLTPRDMTLAPRAAYARDSRLSYLRFVAGDTAGAIALMKAAVTEGVEAQLPAENMAWLYYELGEYETQAGDAAQADAAYLAALNTHPGDYRALAALGKLRANNGRFAEAIVLYQRAIAVVPMPTFISELGDLYAKTGDQTNARKQYALVEYIGLLGHINQVLHNRDLAIFYADHDLKLDEAVDLARKELEVRHDVYTWDALSWALYKNGRLAEAAKASENATRLGTRDALILFHAGMIAQGLGNREQARTELNEALKINPRFHLIYANAAQQKLATLDAQAETKGGAHEDAR